MRKKLFLKLFCATGALALVSCSQTSSWWNDGDYEYIANPQDSMFNGQNMTAEDAAMYMDSPLNAAKVYNKRVPPLNSLVVCRDKQCAPAELFMSREYIFNSLAHLVDNNLDVTALLCEANPQAHVCTNPYLTVPAKVGVTPAYVFFDGVKIVDASIVKGKTALNLALGYNLSYNGQTPTVCKPDTAMMYVKSNNDVVLNEEGYLISLQPLEPVEQCGKVGALGGHPAVVILPQGRDVEILGPLKYLGGQQSPHIGSGDAAAVGGMYLSTGVANDDKTGGHQTVGGQTF